MQIGQGAQWTERAHLEGSLVSGRQSFLVQKEAKIRGTQFSRGRVYGSKFGCMRGYIDEEDPSRVVWVTLGA